MKIDTDCLLIVFNFIPLKELRQLYLLNKYFKKIILEYILFSKFKIADDFIHSLKLDGHDVLSLGLYGSENFILKKKDCYDVWVRLDISIQRKLNDIAYKFNTKIEITDEEIYELEDDFSPKKFLTAKDYYSLAKYKIIFSSLKDWELLSEDLKKIYHKKTEEYNEKYILKSDFIYEIKKSTNQFLNPLDYFLLAKYNNILYEKYPEWNLLNKKTKDSYRELTNKHNESIMIEEKIYTMPNDFIFSKPLSGYEVWYIGKYKKMPYSLDMFSYWLKIKPNIKINYYYMASEFNDSIYLRIL